MTIEAQRADGLPMPAVGQAFSALEDGVHKVVVTADGEARHWRVKVRRDAPEDFFAAEAAGLDALREAGVLRVPEVFEVDRHYIALEDLGNGRASELDWARAGAGLARMHGAGGDAFGFAQDGYCGDSPQPNAWTADGNAFFAEHRLGHQARLAVRRGLLGHADAERIEMLGARLAELVPPTSAVLVHGDLWSGNLHACSSGELALIDGGAVHFGWAEADLAMLILFGEPPKAFFDAYREASGVDADWRERAPIYNLYHLLNHLNLFGESYLGSVRGVLDRFA
ncbi:MAG TPA: fructosamine kinase family protein [Xanthomonadaceae bacterium]|nr:fructosamine kinase family protein [Xanthomonadaceae bacterium]